MDRPLLGGGERFLQRGAEPEDAPEAVLAQGAEERMAVELEARGSRARDPAQKAGLLARLGEGDAEVGRATGR